MKNYSDPAYGKERAEYYAAQARHNGQALHDVHPDDPGPEPPDEQTADSGLGPDSVGGPGVGSARSCESPDENPHSTDQRKHARTENRTKGSGPRSWDAEINTPPRYFDVAALLAGKLPEPPEPDLLQRIDGHRLLYRGQVNVLFGDPESGKTFVALAATVEALNAGRTALVLDLDHNGVEATVARLLMLGANRAALADLNRFRYCEPESALDIFEVVKDCKDWQPTVAVVDSIGELLPTLKADSNNADDFTRAHTNVLKPLARAGAAVIAIDHLAKNNDSRAKGPGGTAAKRRALGGTSLRVKATRPFSPGNGGTALLLVNKDRHGGVRRHAARPEHGSEQSAGTFVLATDYEVSTGLGPWRVLNPSRCDRDPDETADPADIALLNAADPPPRTAEDARKVLRCNKDRANRAYRVWREER